MASYLSEPLRRKRAGRHTTLAYTFLARLLWVLLVTPVKQPMPFSLSGKAIWLATTKMCQTMIYNQSQKMTRGTQTPLTQMHRSVWPHQAAGMCAEKDNDCNSSGEEGVPCLMIGQCSIPKLKAKTVSPVQQPTTTRLQTNRRRLNDQSWSLEEKEIILHCKAYSAHEAWGSSGKGERFVN